MGCQDRKYKFLFKTTQILNRTNFRNKKDKEKIWNMNTIY